MIRLVINFEIHMSRVLGMKDSQCASLFLSNMVGNQIKWNVDDFNYDKMIDRAV